MTSTYRIHDEAHHVAELARVNAQPVRDADEGALTNWGHDSMATYHREALTVIRAGMQAHDWCLYEGERRVAARLISTKFGTCWKLSAAEETLIAKRGKPFLPAAFGGRSNVLKAMGLTERKELVPVRPYFEARCAGLGCPVVFATVPV